MAFERSQVIGAVAARQNAAVQRRVQGLHAAVHHLRETGQLGHASDRQTGVGQGASRASGRHEFEPEGGKSTPQINNAGLVRNTQKGSWHNE